MQAMGLPPLAVSDVVELDVAVRGVGSHDTDGAPRAPRYITSLPPPTGAPLRTHC